MAISDRDKERLNMIAPAANDVGLGDIIQDLQDAESGGQSVAWADITGKPTTFQPSAHTHTASQISDASAVGKSVMTAADAAAARTAIGAGTSNLALGTTASTAAAGNHTHATSAITGLQTALDGKLTATKGAAQADSTATDVAGLVADFNALLAKLRTAGIIST